MSILNRITDKVSWTEYLEFKKSSGHLTSYMERSWMAFIEEEAYIPIAKQIREENRLHLPKVKEINKIGTEKKRIVFVFDDAENRILKLIAYYLHDYDTIFTPNLYSFRKSVGVKRAISDILKHKDIDSMYSYKVDIHDYFNSVDPTKMTTLCDQYLENDPQLNSFIKSLLLEPHALYNNQIVKIKKGIMAGVPVSGFLANLYLKNMDEWFFERDMIYARYSDDVIVFAQTKDEILFYEHTIKAFLNDKGLTINNKKEVRTQPGETWEFLGFSFHNGKIDISDIALQKMKAKIRRKARALVRWKNKTGASNERTIRAFIRYFTIKFYDNPRENELTWCRWYFPILTTDERLHILDEYMVSAIRYIATGKHIKANYNLRYDAIKNMGYRSLVNAYYCYKKTGML